MNLTSAAVVPDLLSFFAQISVTQRNIRRANFLQIYIPIIIYYYYLFLFLSARSIGLRQCLAIRGSCFSFLDPLDIW
jgi:hypothetical protein